MQSIYRRNHVAFLTLFLSALLGLLYVCLLQTAGASMTESLPVSTPEEQGVKSQILADMVARIVKNDFSIDSILIVRNGYKVLDAYFHPFSRGQKHHIYSCTKSIMSALIGIAIEKGYIRSVDQSIMDFFPNRTMANMDDRKKSITLEHLLMMAPGLKCRDSYLYRRRGLKQMWYSYDWAQFVLDLPMEAAPGEKFEYCNGVSYLLSVIIQNTTKRKTLDFARQYLFDPMGIKDVEWERSPEGVDIGYGEMWLQPHDMAKIGLLYLNEGKWGDRQILPSEWVEISTAAHIAAKPFEHYGYHWWVDSDGNFAAAGYKGQRIFVAPDKDLVVVITAHLKAIESTTSDFLLSSYILPAAASDIKLPPNPSAQTRLKDLVKKAATTPVK